MRDRELDRRRFLADAAGVVGLGGVSLLAGCGSSSSPSNAGQSNTTSPASSTSLADGLPTSAAGSSGAGSPPATGDTFVQPAFVPYTGVVPTLPGLPNGTAPYYAKAVPADDRPAFWQGPPPGKGGPVSVLSFMNSTPKAENDNKWWQALNKATGADIKINGAPVGDYPAKFQVTMAGGDLPDMAVLYPVAMPGLGPLLGAKFENLSPYLNGDAIKAYPGLANQPSYT